MRAWGETTERVRQALLHNGPMTRSELCIHLGMDRMYVSAVISRMTKATATIPKRLYICGWTNDSEGQRRYPRAVYCLGDKPDVRYRAPETITEQRRRWRRDERARATMNSVFNLGLTRRQYEAIRRGKIGKHGEDKQQSEGCSRGTGVHQGAGAVPG